MIRLVLSWFACGIFLMSATLQPRHSEVGGAIPKLAAKDQHGNAYAFTNGTAYLLIALDMDSAKAANQKLAAQGPCFLGKTARFMSWTSIPCPISENFSPCARCGSIHNASFSLKPPTRRHGC